MSIAKAKELRDFSSGELDQKIQALEKELHELRQKRVSGQLDKPHLFKINRRQIARILTIRKETENASAGNKK